MAALGEPDLHGVSAGDVIELPARCYTGRPGLMVQVCAPALRGRTGPCSPHNRTVAVKSPLVAVCPVIARTIWSRCTARSRPVHTS